MSSSSANASSGGSSSLPRLGPAWYRGAGNQGGRGFQPPPAVPAERRTRSGSQVSDHSNDSQQGRQQNKFSVLGDDDDNNGGTTAAPVSNSRSEALRSTETRRSSTGKTGRSLADLAARAPPRESYRKHGEEGGRFSGLKGDEGKVIRYTREKLLSMRPPPKPDPPEQIKHLEGTPVLSKVPQDPVCWDTFDADEIWAQAARERSLRSSAKGGSGGAGTSLSALAERAESRRGSTSSAGRWQRGVALPPPEDRSRSMSRGSEGDNPNDLWDDPTGGATGAAADFSAFGAIPDDPKKAQFDFTEMAEASKKFDEELHGSKSDGFASDGEDAAKTSHPSHSVSVDPTKPLAAAGTTIRSGSGDDVNVFEDFDESAEEAQQPKAESASEPIKSADADPNASSRLMKMIGVEATKDTGAVSAWGTAAESTETRNASATESTLSSSVPSNPWGDPIVPAGGGPSQDQEALNLSARLEAAVAEQKAREAQMAAEMEKRRQQEAEMLRRRQEEEAQRRASLIAQQEEQARQQAAMQQQQHQQHQMQQQQQQQRPVQDATVVERILVERICAFLENSWGRSDLMSILSALQADDSQVTLLLTNVDALRALIARHPRRVALRHDPSMGTEMAMLITPNSQWQQMQRAEQEEIQRRQQQERMQAMQAAAARAQAEAKERAAAAAPQIDPDAPWFYADPQNNIQGPFKGTEMRQWLDAGYFKGDLPISQKSSGPFRPLSAVFPDLKMAFQVPESSSAQEEKAKAEEEEMQRKAEELRIAEEKLTVEAEQAEAAAKRQREEEAVEQNQSSTQLKMLLGVGGGSSNQEDADNNVAVVNEKEAPLSKRASAQKAEKRSSSKQTSTKSQKRQEPKPAAPQPAPAPVPKQVPAPPVASSSPPSAWGGAASAAPRSRSMSEIQQEEARRAAILAMERKSAPRQSSGGWANVAASGGGGTGWSSGAVKPLPPAVVTSSTVPMAQARAKQHPAQTQAAQRQPTQRQSGAAQQQRPNSSKDAFGTEGRMSPSLENWCKEQMMKLNGSDDLTLVSYCMTLNDEEEIKGYFTAILGVTPQVHNFANEFINRKFGKKKQNEWETPSNAKKGRKKKGGAK